MTSYMITNLINILETDNVLEWNAFFHKTSKISSVPLKSIDLITSTLKWIMTRFFND